MEHFRVRDVFIARLVSDPRLLDIAEAFIGEDIGFFGIGHWYKPPREGLKVLWHQDIKYWPLDPPAVVTLWLAVTDSDEEKGCMEVIPRSHLELREHHIEPGRDHAFFDGAKVLKLSEEEEEECREIRAQCWRHQHSSPAGNSRKQSKHLRSPALWHFNQLHTRPCHRDRPAKRMALAPPRRRSRCEARLATCSKLPRLPQTQLKVKGGSG